MMLIVLYRKKFHRTCDVPARSQGQLTNRPMPQALHLDLFGFKSVAMPLGKSVVGLSVGRG